MSPKGIPAGANSLDYVVRHVRDCLVDPLNLDDALWCYGYEPQCQKLRAKCTALAGVQTKAELIDWCDAHSESEQRDLLERAATDLAAPHHNPKGDGK